MSRRWLFRVDVANERETGEKEKARGLGHAYKCIALARAVRDSGDTVRFAIEGASDIERLFEEEGFSCCLNEDHLSVADSYDPEVIVIDINYLDIERVTQFRERALTVNIAPRGECKYFADLTFTDAKITDVPKPDNATVSTWYSGPEYTILNPAFSTVRRQIDSGTFNPDQKGVIIQMGGVDEANMTGSVLRNLDSEIVLDRRFTIVAGPYNPHSPELREAAAEFEEVDFVVDPDDYAELVAEHELGIFGTGISTYEGLAVGVPSINLGLTSFHDLRGKELEKAGIGVYLGRHNEITPEPLNNKIRELYEHRDRLERMKSDGLDLVDGSAPQRIVSTTTNHIHSTK